MAKTNSLIKPTRKIRPRLVVYIQSEDLLKIERVVESRRLRNEHDWARVVIDEALEKL